MTTDLPRRPRLHGRQAAFALSVLASVAINAIALDAITGRHDRWQQTTADAPRDPQVIAVVLATSTTPAEPRVNLPVADSDKPSEIAPAPPRRIERQRATTPAPQKSPPAAVRFYAFDEVDEAATPDSDWNLDTGALDDAGVTRLVFEVFVSSRGEVVGCHILEPATLAETYRLTLEDRLRHASMRPARRAGIDVASFRRIELSMVPMSQ